MRAPTSLSGRVLLLALTLGALFALWLALAFLLQRRVLFPRHAISHPALPPAWLARGERSELKHADGVVEWWFLPAPGVSTELPGPALIYIHGNAELIDQQGVIVERYHALGVSVVLCEFRGYGRSTGAPTERGLTADFVALWDTLLTRPDVDTERIAIHGRSIGGGVACALAGRRRPWALILTSPFTSVRAMMRPYGIPSFAVRDPFDNVAVIRELDAPILIQHGELDGVIGIEHARALAALSARVVLEIDSSAGHNDLSLGSDPFWEPIERILGMGP